VCTAFSEHASLPWRGLYNPLELQELDAPRMSTEPAYEGGKVSIE
jgi:hypothetical protein